jgi:alpha-beta hydrolase superfamily lysophospholipase
MRRIASLSLGVAAAALVAAAPAAPVGHAAARTTGDTPSPVPTAARLRVGTLVESTVDHARSTLRRVNGKLHRFRGRLIRLDVWYPAEGSDDGHDHVNAPPATGPFPVIVFAPGYRVTPYTYARTLHAWAQAGYVVVGVEFPGSGARGPGRPTEADLTQQPRDMSLALDRVAHDAQSPGSWAAGRLDLSRVAAAGHSDGASTVVRMVLSTAYRDDRFRTAVILAGGRLGGERYDRADDVPVLLMNGDHDEYNEPAIFRDTWSLAHGRKAWVLAVGGHHLPPFAAPGLQESVIRDIELAWFDHYLKGADTADDFYRLVSAKGLTRLLGGGLPH